MWLAGAVFTSDYGAYGVAFIFSMYWLRDKARLRASLNLFFFAILCMGQHIDLLLFAHEHGIASVPFYFWLLIPATLLAVVPVALYNGKRGPSSEFARWFFYVAYPLHLAVLALYS